MFLGFFMIVFTKELFLQELMCIAITHAGTVNRIT